MEYQWIAELSGLTAAEVRDAAVQWPRYCREMARRYPGEVTVIADSAEGMVVFVGADGVWLTVGSGDPVLNEEVLENTVHLLRRECTRRGFRRAATVEWVRAMVDRVNADRLAEARARAVELKKLDPNGGDLSRGG